MKITLCYEMSFHVPFIESSLSGLGGGIRDNFFLYIWELNTT